jgi:hypothetical protein
MRILTLLLVGALAASAPGDGEARGRRGRSGGFGGRWSGNVCPPGFSGGFGSFVGFGSYSSYGNYGSPVGTGYDVYYPPQTDPWAAAVGPYGEPAYPARPAAQTPRPAPAAFVPEREPAVVYTSPPAEERPTPEPKTVESRRRPPATEETLSDGTRTVTVIRRGDGITEIVP